MDRLWGTFEPVPEASLVPLIGGERINPAGRDIEVMYTPGHAVHHVSYVSANDGVAFVGDTAGVRLPSERYVLPPTPPPDIDLEAWRDSLARLSQRRLSTFFLTHFGPATDVPVHVAWLNDEIDLTSRLVKESFAREGTDQAREQWFAETLRHHLSRHVDGDAVHTYEVAAGFDLNWRGLARYWRKKLG